MPFKNCYLTYSCLFWSLALLLSHILSCSGDSDEFLLMSPNRKGGGIPPPTNGSGGAGGSGGMEDDFREVTCNKSLQLHWGGVIEHIMQSYDKQMLPNPNGVEVTIEMSIQDISALSELTSDFEIDVMFSEIWQDPALSFSNMSLCRRNLTLKPEFKERIWTPDTCIVNSKKAVVHNSPSENSFVILYENGTVWANVRMQVRLRWFGKEPITVAPTELPDFIVNRHDTQHTRVEYPNGYWDQMKVTFTFSRRSGFYVFQAYFPTTLTVISSWIGFCLESRSVSARITLGVSSLLALAFQFGTVLRHLPRVSYIKCIDVWMISCVAFIFFTLVEMSIVSQLATWEREMERSRNAVSRWVQAVRQKRSREQSFTQSINQSIKVNNKSAPVDSPVAPDSNPEHSNNNDGGSDTSAPIIEGQNGVIRRNVGAATNSCTVESGNISDEAGVPTVRANSVPVHTVLNPSPNRPSRWLTLLRDIKSNSVEITRPLVRDATSNSLSLTTTSCTSPVSADLTPASVRSVPETVKLIQPRGSRQSEKTQSNFLKQLRQRVSGWIPPRISVPSRDSLKNLFPSVKRGVRRLDITSQKVDRISMILFPLSFVLFNSFYWGIYFSMR